MECSVIGCTKLSRGQTGLCSAHYQRKWKYGDPLGGRKSNDRCDIEGCEKPPRSGVARLCEMHYMRLRRNGTQESILSAKPERGHSGGYRMVYDPNHLLTSRGQVHVYEHRKVFYDAHGEGPFHCYVCGATVNWKTMDVDHLNDIRTDNRIDNLAPACPPCNRARGQHKAIETRRERHARWIEFSGDRRTLSGWAQRIGISHGNLALRLKRWPIARALTEPRGNSGPKKN